MAAVVITPQESPKYTENLFPYASTLNNEPTIVVTGGGSNGNLDYFSTIKYNRLKSIRAIFTGTENVTFNLGDSFTFTAPSDGNYLISMRLFVPTDYEDFTVSGKLATFINSAGTEFDFSTTDDGFIYGQWNTFTQIIPLELGDLFEAEIKIQTNEIGVRAYLGGFKAELDDRGLGLPSRYTEPYNQLDKTVTLDFPSVSGNDFEDLTTELIGAELGDIVLIGTPILSSHYSFVGFVSDADEVTVRCINDSGGSVNPASGDFKVKIIK
jgi:hypothetical protein